MAWTYTTLIDALQDFVQSNETTYVANLPVIVNLAEDRILKSVQLPDFRRNVTGSMTTANQYLGIPTDFLAPYSLALDNSGHEFLIFKEVNFVREAYPLTTTYDVPRYYAIFDDEFFLLGPSPDDDYPVELHYFYKPESIVTAGTSWLGSNAETVLFDACLLESQIFLKGDADLVQLAKNAYDESLSKLKLLAEGFNKTDSYRSG